MIGANMYVNNTAAEIASRPRKRNRVSAYAAGVAIASVSSTVQVATRTLFPK